MLGFALVANAGGPQRIGHTTLTPRHSTPDDKGMYAAAMDPTNGYAYLISNYLFKLDVTGNLPMEVGCLELQSTTNSHPPNGMTVQNVTTNADGVLSYGEVFFRLAVFDPVRGFAYLGQDSRPNQIVKVQVATVDLFTLTGRKRRMARFSSASRISRERCSAC